MRYFSILAIAAITVFTTACGTIDVGPSKAYDKGVLVINSGNFFDNNGSISLLSRSNTTAQTDIFQKENLRTIQGGISGYAEVDSKGIILIDNSTAGKDGIEIVDAGTFKTIATIASTEIENPRNIIKVSSTKAYITCWDATGIYPDFYKNKGYVAVLDLSTNKITKKIKVQAGAEDLVLVGDEVYVGNTGTYENMLSIIDTKTEAVKQSVEIGTNPSVLKVDANGKLWILADNQMIRFNIATKVIENKVKIIASNSDKTPSSFALSLDKKTFFYISSFYDAADGYKQKGETYSFPITATEVKEGTPFIKRLFGGGLDVDQVSGNIYAGFAPSLKQAGYVFRYSSAGVLIDSVKAEINPSKFYFKK